MPVLSPPDAISANRDLPTAKRGQFSPRRTERMIGVHKRMECERRIGVEKWIGFERRIRLVKWGGGEGEKCMEYLE